VQIVFATVDIWTIIEKTASIYLCSHLLDEWTLSREAFTYARRIYRSTNGCALLISVKRKNSLRRCIMKPQSRTWKAWCVRFFFSLSLSLSLKSSR